MVHFPPASRQFITACYILSVGYTVVIGWFDIKYHIVTAKLSVHSSFIDQEIRHPDKVSFSLSNVNVIGEYNL